MSVDPEQGTPAGNSPAPEVQPQPQAPPVGDPFEPRYKETQAAFTKSQQELAAERAIWQDEAAALARLQEQFPHWFEDDDDGLTPAADAPANPAAGPADDRVDALMEWATAKASEEAQQAAVAQYQADLKEELGDRTVDELGPLGQQYIEARTMALGGNREALTAAVKEWTDANPAAAAPAADPRVPHVPTGGPAGGGQKDPADMTPRERQQFMADRLRADA